MTKVRVCSILSAVKHRFTIVGNANVWPGVINVTPIPGKPGLTIQAKGTVLSPVMLEARRAGCVERRLSGSREAAVSKAQKVNLQLLSHLLGGIRATETDWADAQPWCSKRVTPFSAANPSRGFGTKIPSVRPTLAVVGNLYVATRAAGLMIRLGVRSK